MEFTDILGAVSSVGFPIVMCIMMWKFCSSTVTGVKEAVEGLKATLEKNTEAIQDIVDRLERLERKD